MWPMGTLMAKWLLSWNKSNWLMASPSLKDAQRVWLIRESKGFWSWKCLASCLEPSISLSVNGISIPSFLPAEAAVMGPWREILPRNMMSSRHQNQWLQSPYVSERSLLKWIWEEQGQKISNGEYEFLSTAVQSHLKTQDWNRSGKALGLDCFVWY